MKDAANFLTKAAMSKDIRRLVKRMVRVGEVFMPALVQRKMSAVDVLFERVHQPLGLPGNVPLAGPCPTTSGAAAVTAISANSGNGWDHRSHDVPPQ